MTNRVRLAEQAVAAFKAQRATTANQDQLRRQIAAAEKRLAAEKEQSNG